MELDELKGIKRQIICNRSKKEACVREGMIPKVVSVLQNDVDEDILSTAAQTIGSLCSIDEGILELLKCNGLPVLLGILVREPNGTVAKQLLWTLKLVAKYDAKLLGDCLASNQEAVSSLGLQLQSKTPSVVLNTLQTLQLCAVQSTEFVDSVSSMFDQKVFLCLIESQNKDVVLQSLRLHLHIISSTKKMCSSPPTSDSEEILKVLRMKARQPNDVDLRLAACNCIVAVFIQSTAESSSGHQEPYILATLMDLISLLDEKCVDAVHTMHQLALADEKLGSTIIELDILPKLMKHLEQDSDRHVIDIFSFIADLCDRNELARRQCLDSSEFLCAVCNSLNASAYSVQEAACACFHMLSRSVRGLKMHVTTISKAVDRLLEFAQQQEQRTCQLHAISVLANLCSEPNNLRETLMKNGVLDVFMKGFRAEDVSDLVKSKSLLGIASLAYVSTRDVKQLISSSISQDDVKSLLTGEYSDDIVEHALILIRNMSHNFGPASSPLREHWDLDFILERSLDIGTRELSSISFRVQCIYIAVNVASGTKVDKDAIIRTGWHEAALKFLNNSSDEVREAAMWLLQNLVTSPQHLSILRDLNVVDTLESMDSDPCLYIRGRATIVLEELKKASRDASQPRRRRRQSSQQQAERDATDILAGYLYDNW